MLVSLIIRTLNEARHLPELLQAIQRQVSSDFKTETIVVDSGSDDETVTIAARHRCRVQHIPKEEFSFGRSLNLGCEAARGDILVFVSGHCVPLTNTWLGELIAPIVDGSCAYTYGRQLGDDSTHYSEHQVFDKYYGDANMVPQAGFFVNNANAALARDKWEAFRFDEELTGLEDMHLGKRLVQAGYPIGYVASAAVHHLHEETWRQVHNRFEREAIALAEIMPEASMGFTDFVRCTTSSIWHDCQHALRAGRLDRHWRAIVFYRWHQYLGSYQGTRIARVMSKITTRAYFYPTKRLEKPEIDGSERVAADEGT